MSAPSSAPPQRGHAPFGKTAHGVCLPHLKAAQVFFDLLAAAVGEEAAGLGRVAARAAHCVLFGPAGKPGAFQRFPVKARAGGTSRGEEANDERQKAMSNNSHGVILAEISQIRGCSGDSLLFRAEKLTEPFWVQNVD